MHSDILAGMLYCDITDHLACFVSLKCWLYQHEWKTKSSTLWRQKLSKICGEDEFSAVRCSINKNVDWHTAFINCVKSFYEQNFPWVTVSRKKIKDKRWVTKGLNISIKQIHRLYKVSVRYNNISAIIKYKWLHYSKTLSPHRTLQNVETFRCHYKPQQKETYVSYKQTSKWWEI